LKKQEKRPSIIEAFFLSLLPEKVVDFFFIFDEITRKHVCSDIPIKNMHAHLKRYAEFSSWNSYCKKGINLPRHQQAGFFFQKIDLDTMQSKKIPGLFFGR
jgi:predicted flavoprotein YhiN